MNQQSNEALLAAIRYGDEEALEQFVEANQPLVYAIVKRFHNRRISQEDLFQIGCIGLMKAIHNFDAAYRGEILNVCRTDHYGRNQALFS